MPMVEIQIVQMVVQGKSDARYAVYQTSFSEANL